ncbi:restriction endonuclease [Clostridium swellfunianum]|uniref:restriction endonuclease n=1 Tax=Clostridium swellfunianum TaxID=1367462 RepID=UPI00202F4B0A|nr:restriction endonuclease [Clostridium swellfunianum]MCM0649047.1 restriction endonuclease [Clostridium swellfunianum]
MNIIDIIFNDVSNFLKATLTVLVILLFVQRVYQAINVIKETRRKKEYIQDLKLGVLSKEDLYNYTPREFEEWCAEFIAAKGFTNIEISQAGPDGGKDIVCKRGTETYYVECKRYSYDKNAEHKVELETVRKLVGVMEADCIKNGLIITTGCATSEAIEYANTLPSQYSIGIVEGDDLINQYTNIKHLIYVPEKN